MSENVDRAVTHKSFPAPPFIHSLIPLSLERDTHVTAKHAHNLSQERKPWHNAWVLLRSASPTSSSIHPSNHPNNGAFFLSFFPSFLLSFFLPSSGSPCMFFESFAYSEGGNRRPWDGGWVDGWTL